jgi:hypothetical protein
LIRRRAFIWAFHQLTTYTHTQQLQFRGIDNISFAGNTQTRRSPAKQLLPTTTTTTTTTIIKKGKEGNKAKK